MAQYRSIDLPNNVPLRINGGDLHLTEGSLFVLDGDITVSGNIQGKNVILVNQASTTSHAVRADRLISAGAGLTGGGDLTANRSLSVSFAGNGSASTVARSDHNHDSNYLALSGGLLTGDVMSNKSFTITGGAGGFTVRNPFDSYMSDVTLSWYSGNIPRLRIGGTGAGAAGVFQIQGTGDTMRMALDSTGNATFAGSLTLGTQATTTSHAVRADRSITAGSGLTGGGNLTVDRSLAISWGGDGSAATASRSDHSHSNYAKGVSASYTSVTGDDGTDGWYTLFTVSDASNTPIYCNLRAYAHTSVSFVVSQGFNSSHATISILNSVMSSTNIAYKYVKGVRILSGGAVQIKLNSGNNVNISAQLLGAGTNPVLSSTLVKETGTPTVMCAVDPIINNAIMVNGQAGGGEFYSGANKVWHAGNFNPINYLPTTGGNVTGNVNITGNLYINGQQLSVVPTGNFVRSDTAGQSVNGNFTIAGDGNLWVGSTTGTSGDVLVRNGATVRIQLDAQADNKQTGVMSYIDGSGNAQFSGNVTANKLLVNDTGVVANLNATYINGLKESELTKNKSIVELAGRGVMVGMHVWQQAVPNMTVFVDGGTFYTDSGRRFEVADQSIALSASSATYNRLDVVYLRGSSAGASEGMLAVLTGTPAPTPVAPTVPSDGVPLAKILVRQNIGSILQADIEDITLWRRWGYDASEDLLYALTGLVIDDNTSTITGYNVVNIAKPIKAWGWAASLEILAGQTEVFWQHDLGIDSYALTYSLNVPNRHIYWKDKTANSVTICIDDVLDFDILVDAVITAL